MRKCGINFKAHHGMGDEDYIKCMKEVGFDAVFTGMIEPERHPQVNEWFAKYGLSHDFIHSHFGHINDMWLDCEEGEQMNRDLLESVDRCAQLSVPVCVVHLSSGPNPPSITDIGRRRYTELVEYAAKKGVKIAFENLRKLANVAWTMEAFADCEHVGFCWDTGHELCYTPNVEFMALFGKRLMCTHIHDNRGIPCADDHMLPFDGKLNWDRFAEHIRNSGYDGTLMFEVTSRKIPELYETITAEQYLIKAAAAAHKLRDMVDKT